MQEWEVSGLTGRLLRVILSRERTPGGTRATYLQVSVYARQNGVWRPARVRLWWYPPDTLAGQEKAQEYVRHVLRSLRGDRTAWVGWDPRPVGHEAVAEAYV